MSQDVKNFIGIVIGCALSLLVFWALIFGTWALAARIDDGPKEDARQSLFGNCSKQFKAGVFNEKCVAVVLEDN